MHMVQHVLLLDVVPICLILGLTKVLLRPATRRLQALERAAGPLAHPVVRGRASTSRVMWVWHIPALYDAALEHPSVHVLEHMMLPRAPGSCTGGTCSRRSARGCARGDHGRRSSTCCRRSSLVGLLGIGLTFAPDPLYDFYEQRAPIWGLTAGGDQELAGAIMALEQSIVMGIALAYLFIRALEREPSASERRRERLERPTRGRRPSGRASSRAARCSPASDASVVGTVDDVHRPAATDDAARRSARRRAPSASRTPRATAGPPGSARSKSAISLK